MKKGTYDIGAAIPYIIWSMLFIGAIFSYLTISYAGLKVSISKEEVHFENELTFKQVINCISEEGILIKENFENDKIKETVIDSCFPKGKNFQLRLRDIIIYSSLDSSRELLEYTKPSYLPFNLPPNLRLGLVPLTFSIEEQTEESLDL